MISDFAGRHKFLSNFFPSPVYILIGMKWVKCATVEHAYQASKTLDPLKRGRIVDAPTPYAAKELGQAVRCVTYWNDVKKIIMLELLRQKFERKVFADKLRRTDGHALIEGNHWHDNFWGVCLCERCCETCKTNSTLTETTAGNWLGRLLERVRKDIR